MNIFLGIDIGTSGVKALLLAEDGKVIAKGSAEMEVLTPRPLWVEQEPHSWWLATKNAVSKAINGNTAVGKNVKAIGITGQMLGSVFLDKDMKPLMPCILWLDQRAEEEKNEIVQKIGMEKLLAYTSNDPLNSYWAPKLLWMRKNRPEIYENICKVLFPKDYIRFLLTGEVAIEVADASGSYLLDIKSRKWSKEMLELLDIPRDFFPENVNESQDVVGRLRQEIAEELGLPAGIPVIAGGGDQAIGGIGNGVVKEGIVSCTIGTSGVVFTHTDKAFLDTELRATHSYCHSVKNKWCFFGCTNSAGGSLKWLKDNLAADEKQAAKRNGSNVYELLDNKAKQVKAGSEGLLFLPYLNGERTPYNDPNARGAFLGFSLRHGWPEMIRSVMEGITFSLRDSIEIFRELGIHVAQVRASGGGSSSSLWRQMQADIFNSEVITVNLDEGPAGGAAILAAVGTGYFNSVEEACGRLIYPVYKTEPVKENTMIYEDLYSLYRTLYPALKNTFREHAEIIRNKY